jgi:4-hydroxybenzoyl-CoA thioesterase
MTVHFTTQRRLNFGDCDVSGTAYYPAYLNLLNGVVEEFWQSIGFAWHRVIPTERWGTPTVHLSCDFTRPSTYGDLLRFDLTVTKLGRSSLGLHHAITCDGAPRWTADQVLAASDLDLHTSRPWPDPVRAVMAGLLQPQA